MPKMVDCRKPTPNWYPQTKTSAVLGGMLLVEIDLMAGIGWNSGIQEFRNAVSCLIAGKLCRDLFKWT